MRKVFFFKGAFVAAALTAVTAAQAYDFESGGLCYNILSADEKTVEVTTDGDETLYDELQDVVIPETVANGGVDYKVVAIGEYAFESAPITSVSVPSSVTSMGVGAFEYC